MSIDTKTPENRNYEGYGYLIIALYVLLLYITTISAYLHFTNTVLPKGDPFTYTNGFFVLLDYAHDDFWLAIEKAFVSNWYWLINIMVVIISPILIKEPFSLSLVNILMFGLATCSFYRLARYFKFGMGLSFILSIILWLYPINYGFLTYESVPVLGLDAMFTGILYVALANMIIYALEPEKTRNALLAGISVGLAVWGRGNSLPVVFMVILGPLLVLTYKIWQKRELQLVQKFISFVAISLSMSIIFYLIQWGPITTYYTAHKAFVTRHQLNIVDILPYIKNIPGFFFWRSEDSITTISISWISHIFVLFSLYISFRQNKNIVRNDVRRAIKIISATGVFIYFSTYFINIILFTDPHMTIYNALLIYTPMRLGMTLSIFSLIVVLVETKKIIIKEWFIIPVFIFMLFYGIFLTNIQTPQAVPGAPTPNEVESFSKSLDGLLDGGSLSVLWYRHYNPAILRYYRIKNNLPDLNLYRNKYYDDIWAHYDYSEEKRRKVREEIRKHFEEAGLIIIPEYVDYYGLQNPYSFYKFRDEIATYLNSPESPRFVVRMILYEYDNQRLLVIQREKEANGRGEPLKLPYEPSSHQKNINPDYGSAVIKHKFDSWRCSSTILDSQLFWEEAGPFPHIIERKCGSQIAAEKYIIGAGPSVHDAHLRMPTAWKLQGSNNKVNWIDLDIQKGQTNWADDKDRTFKIRKPGYYKYYRLRTIEGGDPNIVRLYRFDLQ